MRILDFFKKSVITSFLILSTQILLAQDSKITIKQDSRFEQLLAEKRKINSSLNVADRFKVQIFTGEAEPAKKTLLEFRKTHKNIDATIVFHTPIYKVWAGSFKTRIEAEKLLNELKKKFPTAFIVKPTK